MQSNKEVGRKGELGVIHLVTCPNCNKKLNTLPPNYPLFDVQCSGCSFRAQIKTNQCKPKSEVFGAGWEIMEKVLKSGYLAPPLIVNFIWESEGKGRQEIRFYPFVPRTHFRKRQLSKEARRANYKMFNYFGLDKVPHFVLYQK
ncbi:hypothetical protein HZC53_05550 [Candidatus Uhrbacteria bacterium]|nr:hypothetical protein [Candidatus Uhrbacteria bacterium]